MGSRANDLLDVVDAAYKVDLPDPEWLRELAEAARPHLDQGFGIAAFEYYKPEGAQPLVAQRFNLGIPGELEAIYSTVFATMDPAIRLRPFRLGPCITGSELMGMRDQFRDEPHMKKFVQRFGMYDSTWITAAEPSGRGVGFHAGRPKVGWASPAEKKRWGRVAAHLSTAVRLRHALRTRAASHDSEIGEAVLDPKGRVHDASGAAHTPAARELLRRAVLALEDARGVRDTDPDASLEARKALVGARWSLLDRVELDGKRYIVARENAPGAPGPEALSARERQVLGFAKLGHHNKLIAYELGIASSTVRVLLARAAAKLGVRSRRDLLRAFDDGWGPPPGLAPK